jgi:hypothetical protein
MAERRRLHATLGSMRRNRTSLQPLAVDKVPVCCVHDFRSHTKRDAGLEFKPDASVIFKIEDQSGKFAVLHETDLFDGFSAKRWIFDSFELIHSIISLSASLGTIRVRYTAKGSSLDGRE